MVPDTPILPEWKEVTLGELTKESAFGPRFSSDLYCKNGNIGTIRTTDLDVDGVINYETIPYANLPEDQFKPHFLNDGDLLITRSGTCGIPCIFKRQIKPIVAGAFLIRFILKDTVNPIYLHTLLKLSEIQAKIQRMASGGVQKNLTGTNLKKLSFRLPPLPEQKKIAFILSTWDKAIETVEKLIENSKAQKKALMQQLLAGKRRLPGFDEEWKETRLKQLLFEEKARNKDNAIERVLSVTNHSGFILPEDQFSKRVASSNVSNYKVIRRGQFGYNPSRINVGSFARLDNFDVGILSPMYVIFSIDRKRLNSDYFLTWMSSNEAKQRILGSTQGSVRDSVGFDALCGFPFKLPPLKEQQKIATVHTTTDKEIETLQQTLDYLKQEKKSLM